MSNNIKPIEDPIKQEQQIKQTQTTNNKNIKTINNLPSWNIEPPLKINRGQK